MDIHLQECDSFSSPLVDPILFYFWNIDLYVLWGRIPEIFVTFLWVGFKKKKIFIRFLLTWLLTFVWSTKAGAKAARWGWWWGAPNILTSISNFKWPLASKISRVDKVRPLRCFLWIVASLCLLFSLGFDTALCCWPGSRSNSTGNREIFLLLHWGAIHVRSPQ